MKYNATMRAYWKDIADTVRRMTTPHQLDCVKTLAEDSDSRLLLDWFKDNFGKLKVSKCGEGYDFECTPQNLKILYDHKINNSGDDFLTLTWAQLVAFIQGNKNFVFDKSEESEEEPEQSGKEISDNIPKIGSYVKEDMLGDELTFDQIADMVGEIIVYDHSTESRAWYKVVKIEKIIDGSDGKRHLRFYDGSKQRGMVNEIFFDKSHRRPQRAWRIKTTSGNSYYDVLKTHLQNVDFDVLSGDYCPGDFFKGATCIYNSDSCDSNCERCWNQQARFEYKPAEDVEVPDEWKAEDIKEESDFPCDNCALDDNGCSDYPDTPDDYCVCGDKQVPVTAEDSSITFDYSELDNDTAVNLRKCENVIRTETAGYFTMLGAKFKEAQELLASHSSGTFEKWYTSMGFKRQTVYNLIQRFEFSSSPTIGGREESFEALPLTLSYAISKPDAPSELVEKVLDGDISSNAEYKKLKAELERTREELRQADANSAAKDKEYERELAEAVKRAENAEFHKKRCQEGFDRVADASKANREKYDVERRKNEELEKRIRELEKKPVDVAVVDNSAELTEKDEEIAELREQLERLNDKRIKNYVIKLSDNDLDFLLKLVTDCGNITLETAVKKAQLLRV